MIAKCTEFVSCIPDLSERQQQWTEISVKALENATPEPIPYEELDINRASVGLTRNFTPTLRQNFSGWKPK